MGLLFLSGLCLVSALAFPSGAQTGFNCNSGGTCKALVGYVPQNATTLSAVKSLFDVKTLRLLLGANDLPLSTPSTYAVPAKSTVKVPINCICRNGTGVSNRRPVYTVQSGEGLYRIASQVFSGLVEFPNIQKANNITDPDLIDAGQKLWIPLPCSCDDVDGQQVVHYARIVEAGGSLEAIAQEYGTQESSLMQLNGLASAKDLKAGQVLDVPLRACASVVSNSSFDYPLLVSNGTYAFTANNCVKCRCDSANNWTLQCEPSQLKPANWATCPSMQCDGANDLYIGNKTSLNSCNSRVCAYAGFNNQTILTNYTTESTCPSTANNASSMGHRGSSWIFLFISIHLAMLCLTRSQ